MGNQATSPVAPVLNHVKSWPLSRIVSIVRTYREGDFDFGIDASTLSALVGIELEKANQLVQMHARNGTGLVNVLSLLASLAIFADFENLNEPVRCGAIFDIIDFNGAGSISSDEFSILVLTLVASFGLTTGQADKIPLDADILKYSRNSLESMGKKVGSISSTHTITITKEEFQDWVRGQFFTKDCLNVNTIFARVLATLSPPIEKD